MKTAVKYAALAAMYAQAPPTAVGVARWRGTCNNNRRSVPHDFVEAPSRAEQKLKSRKTSTFQPCADISLCNRR